MVRGVDQTGRAFRQIDQRIDKMIKREMELSKVTRREAKERIQRQLEQVEAMQNLESASYRLLFAGAAFLTFGAMVVMGLSKIIGMSSAGALYIEDFRTVFHNLGVTISESIIKYWGPAITGFIDWLDDLGRNETFRLIVGGGIVPITISLVLMGLEMVAVGLVGTFLGKMIDALVYAGFVTEKTALAYGPAVIGAGMMATVLMSTTLVLTAISMTTEGKFDDVFTMVSGAMGTLAIYGHLKGYKWAAPFFGVVIATQVAFTIVQIASEAGILGANQTLIIDSLISVILGLAALKAYGITWAAPLLKIVLPVAIVLSIASIVWEHEEEIQAF